MELTKKQKELLNKHEKHHTKQHMNFMKSEMKKVIVGMVATHHR